MVSSLFRKEALEHRKDRLYGEIILIQPLPMTILISMVTLICVFILMILFWGTYARKETVKGHLLPDKGIVKAYALREGTVTEIHVKEGEEVKQGQTLLTILSQRSLQGGQDIDILLLHEIEHTSAHQLERIQGEQSLLSSETIRLNNRIQGLGKELQQIKRSLQAQASRMEMLKKRVAGAKKLLENKHISEHEYQKLYEEWLVQKQQDQELLRHQVNKQNELSQVHIELEQLPIRTQARINEIQAHISELKQRYTEIEGRRMLEIHSPISGVVTALQAREGEWQNTHTPLLTIMPKDANLQVELFIPSRAIGFISAGQVVRIRYDAFPYQRYGIYQGKIIAISKHVLLPSELSTPMDVKEPVYRVTVALDRQTVSAYGKVLPLQAGMSLEADIILDKQTLFERIFDPLISLKGRF